MNPMGAMPRTIVHSASRTASAGGELNQAGALTGGPPPTYYLLSDLLYRGVALTDASKTIQEAYDTDAYGNTLAFSGPGADTDWFTDDDAATNAPTCPSIFSGRRYDPETRIYFYRARYYDPALGRFVSRDPVRSAHDTGRYEYAEDAPTKLLDATGEFGIAALYESVTSAVCCLCRDVIAAETKRYKATQDLFKAAKRRGLDTREEALPYVMRRAAQMGRPGRLEGRTEITATGPGEELCPTSGRPLQVPQGVRALAP